jgi:hypothetical protein
MVWRQVMDKMYQMGSLKTNEELENAEVVEVGLAGNCVPLYAPRFLVIGTALPLSILSLLQMADASPPVMTPSKLVGGV